jgi:hypothetical protein
MHSLSPKQQAPAIGGGGGCGQEIELQVTPSPWKIPLHADESTSMHEPSDRQHAPGRIGQSAVSQVLVSPT